MWLKFRAKEALNAMKLMFGLVLVSLLTVGASADDSVSLVGKDGWHIGKVNNLPLEKAKRCTGQIVVDLSKCRPIGNKGLRCENKCVPSKG
jgi:hypothetical protein